MKTVTFNLDMMYGDHHVIEVRKLISSIPGVEDVYASSCFHIVEVQYDENKVDEDEIRDKLDDTGYLGELSLPVEIGTNKKANGQEAYFRHTAVLEQTGDVVSFAQKAPYEGRPLWPCPGVGPLQDDE